jgi:hypothetical protein
VRAFLLARRARKKSEIDRLDAGPFAEQAPCRSTARATVATRDQRNMRAREDLRFIMGWFAKPLLQPSFHVLIGAPKRKRFAGLEPTIWHHDSRADR